jgi:3-phenylpropionate/trans-cinnamate dioxygenase ferredoxin component
MTEWPIARLDTIPEGEAHGVAVDGREIVLCPVDGEVCALSGICTHEDRSLSGGEVEGGVLTCPWHGARFDIRSGRVLALPALRPLKTFAVRVDGDGPVHLELA